MAEMQRRLHQESVPSWGDGWALAESYGPAAADVLRAAFKQESNALKRLLWLGAAIVARRGSDRDSFLLEVATSDRVEERAIAVMSLAVAPARPGPCQVLEDLVANEKGGTTVQMGAALASVRFAGGKRVAPLRSMVADTETIAAAVRGDLASESLRRFAAGTDDLRRDPAADLVLRAALLGGGGDRDVLRDIALELLGRAGKPAGATLAAAIHVARTGLPVGADLVRDPAVRAAFATSELGRRRLRQLELLGPSPEVLADRRTQMLLAAGYGLTAPWPAVAADVTRWAETEEIAGVVALSLTWRVLAHGLEDPAVAERVLSATPVSPGKAWLGFALGRDLSPKALAGMDRQARRVAELAAGGRLDRPAVAAEVEGMLWRAGVHPGCVAEGAWVDLVRDALLSGSELVSARLQLEIRPPSPRGIEPSHTKFFMVADSLLRFLTERVPEPPPELRLR